MNFILFLLIFALIEWYIFNALNVLVKDYPLMLKRVLGIIYWGLSIGFVSFLILIRQKGEGLVQNSFLIYVQSFFMIYYISKTLLVLLLLVDDFRRFFMGWIPRLNPSGEESTDRSKLLIRLGLVLAALPFATLLYGKIRNTFRFKILRHQVSLPHLPDSLKGLRIVQISDIHSGSFFFQDPLKRAVRMINDQKADLVFFTGDLVNSTAEEMTPFMEVLNKIESRYGVFSVFGNHDYGDYAEWPDEAAKTANLERMKQIHQQLGWDLLLNSNRSLSIGEAKLSVIGVENYSVYDRFPTFGRLEEAYRGSENADIRLLLSHDPSHWEAEVTNHFQDIDLTFSGHTHGFQFGVDIPGWIKWSPAQLLYKQWAGLYTKGKQHLYVNRGLGFIGYAGRVGILPEITVIELTA